MKMLDNTDNTGNIDNTDKKGAEVAVKMMCIRNLDLNSKIGVMKIIRNEINMYKKWNMSQTP